jgi:hypothetical protein
MEENQKPAAAATPQPINALNLESAKKPCAAGEV